MWQVELIGTISVVRSTPGPVTNVRVPEHIWGQLDVLVAQRAMGQWLVDVSSERLVTSEALAMIVGMVRRVQAAGGRMAFARCSPGVSNVLISMRLAKMLPIYATVEDGVAALALPASSASTGSSALSGSSPRRVTL